MTIIRNTGGYWIVRYKNVAYYTGTRNVGDAIAFAHKMNGSEQKIY